MTLTFASSPGLIRRYPSGFSATHPQASKFATKIFATNSDHPLGAGVGPEVGWEGTGEPSYGQFQ